MPLFEVAIIEAASGSGEKRQPERLVFGPRAVVAKDPQAAVIAVVTSAEYAAVEKKPDSDRVEAKVRGF